MKKLIWLALLLPLCVRADSESENGIAGVKAAVEAQTPILEEIAAIEHGDQAGLKKWLVATVALGIFFLSVQAYEYTKLIQHGLTLASSLYGSCFFTLTGFHGAHVTIGVGCMIFTAIKAFRGGYSKEYHYGVEIMGLYWHFVDLVWIILFTIVYLI